jgi:hypothetical protein
MNAEGRISLERYRHIVEGLGGVLLSRDFIRIKRQDQSTYYYLVNVRCANGHEWAAPCQTLAAHEIGKRKGSWCRQCFLDRLRTDIIVAAQIAQQKGGRCLTTTYCNQDQKLSMNCAEGHAFNRTMLELKQFVWCPYCRESQGERVCRYILEQMFAHPFPRRRPDFLRCGKSQLEFDGYNEDERVAFEYQGEQHYSYFPHVHGTREAYRAQRRRDARKRELVSANGVLLIEVPYFPRVGVDAVEHVKQHVEYALKLAGRRLPPGLRRFSTDISGAYLKGPLQAVRQLVEERGGQLLTDTWPGSKAMLSLRCAKGHQWQATASKLTAKTNPRWCGICKDEERRVVKGEIALDKLQRHAEKMGGKFLENEYFGSSRPHWWSCAEGHRWQAAPVFVIGQGTWCRVCRLRENGLRSRTVTVDKLSAVAARHGGKFLSEAYLGPDVKHKWECLVGHQWWALVGPILNRGVFCAKCGRRRAAITRWGEGV